MPSVGAQFPGPLILSVPEISGMLLVLCGVLLRKFLMELRE